MSAPVSLLLLGSLLKKLPFYAFSLDFQLMYRLFSSADQCTIDLAHSVTWLVIYFTKLRVLSFNNNGICSAMISSISSIWRSLKYWLVHACFWPFQFHLVRSCVLLCAAVRCCLDSKHLFTSLHYIFTAASSISAPPELKSWSRLQQHNSRPLRKPTTNGSRRLRATPVNNPRVPRLSIKYSLIARCWRIQFFGNLN